MAGGGSYSFTASSLPSHRRNLGVPARESGTPADSSPQTTSLWYEQAFPAGTTFGSPSFDNWSWTYLAGSSGNGCTQGNGNGQGKGQNNGNDNGWLNGHGQGNGNDRGNGQDYGNRGRGNSPSCSCGDDHGRDNGQGNRGRNNNQGKGCPQSHGNQSQNGNQDRGAKNRGGQDGNKGGNQPGGPSKPSGQKWTDAYNCGGGWARSPRTQ